MNTWKLVSSACLLLAGCQSISLDFYQTPGQLPPEGSIVELHQTLLLQPGYSRSFIQNGKAIEFSQLRVRDPYCLFYRYEEPAALQSQRQIQPDRFVITDSWRSYHLVSTTPAVSGRLVKAFYPFDNDGPSSKSLTTIMELESATQPEIVQLRCAIFSDPFPRNFLTLDDISKTLGSVVTLQINS